LCIPKEANTSPDELSAKDFRRRISACRRKPSSRRRYYPYGKRNWIEAIKKTHKQGSSICAGDLQNNSPHLYHQGVWIFGDWDKALSAARFDPEKMRMRRYWDRERVVMYLRQSRRLDL
jgi:hypothetical protein